MNGIIAFLSLISVVELGLIIAVDHTVVPTGVIVIAGCALLLNLLALACFLIRRFKP